MRAGVPGLPSPHPIGAGLPAMYQEDEFVQRFTAGLDEVLAPVLLTLDCLDAYLDPGTAPVDFLDWLAGWLAVPVDPGWSVELRRRLVAEAVELHRWRGTRRGLEIAVRLQTGGDVEVTDTGGVTWSATTGSPVPPPEAPQVMVRVRVDDPDTVDRRRLAEVVAAQTPAHVGATVEVLRRQP